MPQFIGVTPCPSLQSHTENTKMTDNAIELQDRRLLKHACYVNGEWTGAESGKLAPVVNPSTSSVVGRCPEFDAKDTEAAVQAASFAFNSYRKTSARERARYLRKWYHLMVENAEDLAHIITAENGKPIADARGEVNYAASFLEWFSEEAPRVYGDSIPATNPSCKVITLKEPVGVCSLVIPWNFPAAMMTPSRAGIPAGVVNVITASENTQLVGEILTTHPAIKKFSFTGSTGVGKLLMKQCSSTIKKTSFELGGNAPFIVFEDADLEAALRGLIASKFRISGQTCVCANRIFVHRGVYDRFAAMVTDAVKTFKVGDGFAAETTHGPLIHDRAVAKVASHVEDAVSKGARVLHGGKPLPHLGPNYFDVTVLADMKPGMRLFHEETFGPVAALFPFETEDEVICMANDCDVGLAGYFFSRDVNRCWRVSEALEVGMVGVNLGAISDPAAPFGGVKQSGFGREGSKYGVDEFTVTKMVMTGVKA
ncbi:hypothetical protein VUR80DRAFT_4924 [Thermomyces stellatus]